MKISIVTPNYNKADFLENTMESVLAQQGKFYLEYIIVDNCSTDNSISIIKKYESLILNQQFYAGCNGITFRWISEPDRGMYDALNKGFSLATGDIFAWINADDIYLPGALDVVMRTFVRYPGIDWLKGITSYIDASSKLTQNGRCYLYNQEWLQQGVYGREAYFVQQDSVFWRAELWHKCRGIPDDIKLAGDYWLWVQFSKLTPIYTINYPVSCFRNVEGQLSTDYHSYQEECYRISPANWDLALFKRKAFFLLSILLPSGISNLLYIFLWWNQVHEFVDVEDHQEPVLRKTRGCIVGAE